MSNKPCQQINVPTTDNTNLPCNGYIDCSCIVMTSLTGEVETYFGLGEDPSLCEANLAFALSLIDARTRIAFLESVEGGGSGINTQINSDWNSVSGVSQILNKPTLSTVATTGSYTSLTETPTLSAVSTSGLYSDIIGTPVLANVAISNDYSDLLNKPVLANVATSGAYTDISGTPILANVATSGNYTDLINRPILATVATTNNYTDLTNKPTLGTMAGQASADYTPTTLLAAVALSGDYTDLKNKPTIPTKTSQLTNDGANEVDNFATLGEVEIAKQEILTESNEFSGAITFSNIVVLNPTVKPTTPVDGTIIRDSQDSNILKIFVGTSWFVFSLVSER